MIPVGLGQMGRVQLKTGWKALGIWIIAVAAMMWLTAKSISDLYDTPIEIERYASTVGSGAAVRMFNGLVAGMDTIGGIFAAEFAFVAAFGTSLMGLALVSRSTRREEESGRLELLLASPIGRRAPLWSAVTITFVALVLAGLGSSLFMIAYGSDAAGSVMYGLALAALGAVFAGATAIIAQLVGHSRTVWGIGIAAIVVSYLWRGLAAVYESPLIWVVPHGWFDKVAAFGDTQIWVLVMMVVVAIVLAGVGIRLNALRDLSDAFIPARPARQSMSPFYRRPVGIAITVMRNSIIGFGVIAVVMLGTYGAVSQQVLDAIEQTPDLKIYFGEGGVLPEVVAMFSIMGAIVATAFLIQALGTLRREETTFRAELLLSGEVSRSQWMRSFVGVAVVGTVIVTVLGGLAMSAAIQLTTGQSDVALDAIWTSAVLLIPTLAFGALWLALYGIRPGWASAVWGVMGVTAVLSYMGPGLKLPDAIVDILPYRALGKVPVESINLGRAGLVIVGIVIMVVIGFIGFRRRNIPHAQAG